MGAEGARMAEREFERRLDAKLILSIVATGIMSFSGVCVETAMNVTFPTLMDEFGVGTSEVQWLTTAYLLMLAAIMPTSSYLNRRFRTKTIFMVAMSLYISGIVIGFTAQSFFALLLGRIVEGLGTGIALPLMFNIITEQAPLSNMGLMMGIGSLITAIAPAVGPSVGGWLAEAYSWRAIFACLLPFLAVSFLLGTYAIRQSHEVIREPFDVRSWAALVASFASLVFATSEASTNGWSSPVVLGLLGLFAALLVVFVRLDTAGGDAHLINLPVLLERRFTLSLLCIVTLQFIVLGLSFLTPNYSQLVMGTGATEAGSILLPGCLLGAILSPLSGRILDRMGARRPILAGCTCALAALSLFALLSTDLTTRLAMAIYMLFTLGQGLTVGNSITNGLSFLGASLKADGNAVINTLQQLAGALGTSVVTTIVAASQATGTDVALTTMAGTRNAYLLLAALSIVPLVAQSLVFFGRRCD